MASPSPPGPLLPPLQGGTAEDGGEAWASRPPWAHRLSAGPWERRPAESPDRGQGQRAAGFDLERTVLWKMPRPELFPREQRAHAGGPRPSTAAQPWHLLRAWPPLGPPGWTLRRSLAPGSLTGAQMRGTGWNLGACAPRPGPVTCSEPRPRAPGRAESQLGLTGVRRVGEAFRGHDCKWGHRAPLTGRMALKGQEGRE